MSKIEASFITRLANLLSLLDSLTPGHDFGRGGTLTHNRTGINLWNWLAAWRL